MNNTVNDLVNIEKIQTTLSTFDEIKGMIDTVAAQCGDMIIHDKPSLEQGKELLKNSDKVKKAIETKRKSLTSPLDEYKKTIMNYEKSLLESLSTGTATLRQRISKYEFELEAARLEELRKIQEEQRQIELERRRAEEEARKQAEIARKIAEDLAKENEQPVVIDTPTPPPVPIEQTMKELEMQAKIKALEADKSKNISMVWTFDIVDIEAIPREYLILDEAKVKNAIKYGIREISGIKIYQKPQFNNR